MADLWRITIRHERGDTWDYSIATGDLQPVTAYDNSSS